MTNKSPKPRVIKDFENLPNDIQEQIKLHYPYGFDKKLISFKNIKGKFVSALPFESESTYYLVRMTKDLAYKIVQNDDDYDEDGVLKEDVMEDYLNKYEEIEIPPDMLDESE